MAIYGALVAYACAAAVGWTGHKLGWLDFGGAVAAAFVGGTIFAFGGWPGAALLLTFFITSSLLTRLPKMDPIGRRPASSAAQPRTFRQVLANGGVAALFALGMGSTPGAAEGGAAPAALAFAGSLAAVTADTWASEVGRFFGQVPRSAITFRALKPGESGGMTTAGTLAGMMGAASIGWAAAFLLPGFGFKEAAVLEAAGAIGMWFDSLLGASLQFKGECPCCGRIVEDPRHPHPLVSAHGLTFFDNDVVNLFAALTGAGLAVYLGMRWA